MKPIISIITPFYNAGEYIKETANSVINQTFKDFEWIIVDDNSDEQNKIKLKEIEKLDKRIKIIFQKEPSPNEKNRPQTKRTVPKRKYPNRASSS